MLQSPRSEHRPADLVGAAIKFSRMASGEVEDDTPEQEGKDPAAVALSRKGG
jgi:hypothetical protein